MMGKSHAMSASAVALTAAAIGIGPIDAGTTPLSVLFMYTAVVVGGSLWPDWDSGSSTVVRSFGIFGRMKHHMVDVIGLAIYNLTKTKYDSKRTDGHRTFFHTAAAALLLGLTITLLSLIPGSVVILGKTFLIGQLFSLIVMWAFFHVGLAGLFEKQIKKARKKFGPYLMMAASLITTFIIAATLPEMQTMPWLGAAAVIGIIIHTLGDGITKMGVPLFWPLKIKGKRWYDVSLPSFMRITAGGVEETVFLFPLFTTITVISAILCLPEINEWFRNLIF